MNTKRTSPKLVLLMLLVVAVGIAGRAFWTADAAQGGEQYDLAAIERGDLRSTVTATGTLSARKTVAVGTPVSGTLAAVYADFNDLVDEGQLLALIDPDALDAAIRDARAGLAQAHAKEEQAQAQFRAQQAQLADVEADLERKRPLHDQGILAAANFLSLEAGVTTARAQVEADRAATVSAQASIASAEAALDRALKNRRDAEIRSPIRGVVISRDIDEGQTVAASFSAPTLFQIAEDLAQMEILVNVDESDIGRIEAGQSVVFTVASHPDRTFEGTAQKVRLKSETISNVVNYTVVVETTNDQGLLLPGMTATVEFVIQQVRDALLVPAQAFDVRPNVKNAEIAEGLPPDIGPEAASQSTVSLERSPDGSPDVRTLWTLDASGSPQKHPVRAGATNGFTTEIVPIHGDLAPNTLVIVGIAGQAIDQPAFTPFPAGRPKLMGGRS